MAKLILSMDGLVLKEIPLSKERTTIGRKPHNDIQIDNLAVSGEHAVIVTILNDCFLEDLGSTNGTLVNGNPVKKHFLQNNDVVELGKYRLKFVGEAPVPAATAERADFEKTMVLRPSAIKAAADQARAMGAGGAEAARASAAQQAAASATSMGTAERATPTPTPSPTATTPLSSPAATTPTPIPALARPPAAAPAAPAAAAPAAAAPKSPHPLGAIQILSGGNAGKELELAKPLTTLGKPGVQVAVLTRRPQGYFITHVEGANPPQVNGQAIGTAPHALKDHDVVELAGVKMEFFLKG
ncbi:MAG TPA: FHA domain-containing protein [Burkholderiales bacterium]|nr:FHA domain-containing protein [Burkholderiales bacterium]